MVASERIWRIDLALANSVTQATNHENSVLLGLACLCVTLDLNAEPTNSDRPGLFRASVSVPSQTPYRGTQMPHK